MTGGENPSNFQETRHPLPVAVVIPQQQEQQQEHQEQQETKNCNMRMNQPTLTPQLPNFFSPRRLLIVFCVINLLNYVDRGAIASNGVNGSPRVCSSAEICSSGTGIQGNFNLNNFQDGVLSSSFMVGLLVASPIFASLTKNHNAFRLIGVGLSIWTLAAAGCGAAFDFWSIAVCRMFVGVGEASFVSLAAPFIDDNAPSAQKTAWLAMFYMCIPTGIALGYVYGGYVGAHTSWRYAFWGEALLMAPFVILGFMVKPLDMKGFAPSQSKRSLRSGEEMGDSCKNGGSGLVVVGEQVLDLDEKHGFRAQISRFWKDFKVLVHDKVYVVNVGGYIFYNFVIGAYSYWGPKAGYSIYGMKNADMVFGGITIACGIIGTLLGGYVLDRMTATISNAFRILSGSTLFGAVFCFGAFCMTSLPGFIALFSMGELLVFATQAPVNFVCLHCVSPGLRPLSMAMSTVSIHVFGDVPSAPLVGVLQDNINNWRATALILTSILFIAAGIWFIGVFMKCVDKFEHSSDDCISPAQNATMKPLLKGKQDKPSIAL